MNKQRRKRLSVIWSGLEAIADEEQAALDNLPESLQCSEKAELIEEAIAAIEEAKDTIEPIC